MERHPPAGRPVSQAHLTDASSAPCRGPPRAAPPRCPAGPPRGWEESASPDTARPAPRPGAGLPWCRGSHMPLRAGAPGPGRRRRGGRELFPALPEPLSRRSPPSTRVTRAPDQQPLRPKCSRGRAPSRRRGRERVQGGDGRRRARPRAAPRAGAWSSSHLPCLPLGQNEGRAYRKHHVAYLFKLRK